MKKIKFLYLPSILGFLIAMIAPHTVSAHGDEPRVEISAERLNPGGVVNVRGVSFGMDDVVTLTLLSTGVEIPLGEITANGEGEFLQIVELPTDLVEGTYYFRATTIHHWVISPPLTVWGAAVVEGGGQGPRDEDDGLFAPMPTVAPAVPPVASTDVPSMAASPQPVSSWNITELILGVSIAALAVIFMGLRKKRMR